MKARHLDLLENIDRLPPSAIVPVPVAAAHKGLSEKSIRRLYPLTPVSDCRVGVRKSDLDQPLVRRRRGPRKPAAAALTVSKRGATSA
jgi:hypothetical protein